MMKLKILFFVLLCSFYSMGQVSLVSDDFGAAATNPLVRTGWVANAASGSNWETRTTSPSSGYSWVSPAFSASGGANAFTNLGTNNNTKTLTYDNSLSTVGYTSLAVRVGGLKSGTVPTIDVSYSTDGATYISAGTITLTTTWAAYSVGLPVGAEGATNLRIRFSVVANSTAGNFLRLDDFQVVGNNVPSSYSGVTAGAGAEPAAISSLTNTLGAASLNFDFLVTDDANIVAANDALPTLISQIVIPQGTGNTIGTWTQAILGAQLNDGLGNTATGTINATNITFSGINTATLGNILDGATKTYTLKIWLNTAMGGTLPDTVDGLNFVFKIDRTNFTTASSATSTQMESGTGTAVDSGAANNVVNVVATKLACTNTPGATQYVGVNFATAPIIKAQDTNNNLDLNYASAVTSVTNTGSLGMSNAPTTFAAGLLTVPAAFQYTAAGNGTLTVVAPSVSNATTPAITVYNSLVTLITNGAVAAAPVLQSATNWILTTGRLTATNGNTTLNTAALITGGTYLAADIQAGGFKLWTSTGPTFGSASQVGVGVSSAAVGTTETVTFSGLTVAVNVGTPIYYWLTVDIAAAATSGRTIRKEVSNATDFTFSNSVNKTGTYVAGGYQTITPLAPEINVQFGATNIPDGDITQSGAKGLTYTAASGATITRTYTIQNVGTSPLTISSIGFSGAGSGYFSVTTALSSNPIAASGSATFTVTFAPLAIGTYNVTLTINNNDSYDGVNETVYDYLLLGTATASATSDLFYVAASSPATISSTMNDASPLTIATGVQVMQFQLRDGGGATDADNLGTTLTGFTITQSSNTASNWLQAIKTIELFDLSTNANVGIGVITATTVTFSGLNVSVADGATKTLSLRMSLNCGLGSVADNEYFGLSIANGTTTVQAGGSTMSAFAAVRNLPNAGNTLKIAVVATQLSFTSQPITVGVNTAMPDVVVKAVDACGNVDLGFTTAISITSSGTMTGSPISVTAVAGVATFSNILHTVIGTNLQLTTASALPVKTSNNFDITTTTVLKKGDLAILAVNTTAEAIGSADEISFVCFQDILPGTTMYLTDNGYERVFAGLWGNTEGIISMTKTTSTLPKGSVITIHTQDGGVNSGSGFTVYTCGVVDSSWTKGVASTAGYFFDLNKNDQVWITQGGAWGNVGTANHDATYSGNVLYGWTDIPWKTVINYASTQGSTIYPGLDCYTTDVANPIAGASQVKFNDPVNPDFSTATNGKYDWIALINDPANWDYYSSDALYDSSGYNYSGSTTCPTMIIATDLHVNGKWVGRKDINWFNCGNWDTLTVPDATVDVQVGDNTFNNQATVDATATFANIYGPIAKTKNLTITGEKVEIVGNSNNKLEVHGDLLIDTVGINSGDLDMDDGTAAADGQLYLYGNWTNNVGNTAFEEGNGTVQFVGSTSQIINNVTPEGTETFYNVVLDNNFDTAVSNDLIATGDLTINTTRNVSIDSNGYIQANKKLTHNGNLTIENNGQFIQVDEADTNTGTFTGTKIQVKRTAQVKHFDYVYWCAPTDNFPVASLPNGFRYEWDTLLPNANGTQGNWVAPTTTNMTKGKGYIARASNGASSAIPMTVIFNDKPHNGQFTFPINRGTYTGADYDADPANATNALTTKYDDNWNLVGNPYPSAIDAEKFLVLNQTKIEGSVWIWKHGLNPALSGSPFYQNFLYNYSSSDLIKYNGLGSTEPDTFAGAIGSGQGFLVNMLDAAAQPGSTITFANSLRRGSALANGTYDNSDFFRSSTPQFEEKSRIWLDIFNAQAGQQQRALIGYSTSSTLGKDHLYDCFDVVKSELNLYSLIDSEPYVIQGRPLPFDRNDMVPLGMKIETAGNHTIAIKKADGLFTTPDQEIYLQDKYLNIIHDLRQAPYTFSTVAGRFDDRFILRYTNELLGNPEFGKVENNVVVSTNKEAIDIKSYSENINSIVVYDVLGREIFHQDALNDTSFSIHSIQSNQQVLLLKIKLANGQTVTKKILF